MIRSYHLRTIFERSLAGSARQAGSARAAASMARRVSDAPMSGTEPTTEPSAGLSTSKRRPESASSQAPST